MRYLLYITLALALTPKSRAYTASTCPSSIPENERSDCFPSGGASESGCISKGCTWCETSNYNNPEGYPWCFYDSSSMEETDCTSCSCSDKVDCYPEAGSTQDGCEARGCAWCPSQITNEPWCIYVADSSSSTASGATTTTGSSSGQCTSCNCQQKVDCYPEAGSSESGCESRGCMWCPSNTQGDPWCILVEGGSIPTGGTGGTGGECPTTIPESARIDCWPGGGATEQGCQDAGCIWCSSNVEGTPWCFFNTTDLPPGIDDDLRINCIPEGGFSPNACSERGCQFAAVDSSAAPMCYFPDTYGYVATGDPITTSTGYQINLQRVSNGTLFGGDYDNIAFTIDFDSDSRVHWKFTDLSNGRFEVPLTINSDTSGNSDRLYEVNFYNDPTFSFQIIRKSSGTILWDTSLGGLTFSEQFLQIATKVPGDATFYGFGETEHATLRHEFDWSAWGMYARDQPPSGVGNLYGVHPFYIAIEDDSNSHGVLFLNSAAQDITFTPAPGLLYRTIGGILDFYMFLGSEPKTVIEQYNKAIGTPFFPPYWSLGFQLCRYGYGSLEKVQETVDRMDSYGIPQDVQYGDIDYMDEQRDFTYDTTNYYGLPDYVRTLQSQGKHYVVILDPCLTADDPEGTYLPYERGVTADAYVKTSDGSDALGKVWPPGNSVFPDYSKESTVNWWSQECQLFHDTIPFDGLWIDMNEPANFVTGSTSGCENNLLNNPPYHPLIWGDTLADKTLCPDFQHEIGTHYDTHSLYGWSESLATHKAAFESTGKRPFVISRSTFPGSGQWAAHWLGDNSASWYDLKMSVIGMLEFNMFGIPYVGADICGFNGEPSVELCDRWMELGSFYPFSRNHNGIGYAEQDPAAFGDAFAQRSKIVLLKRYTLLPYLYTLFYHANTEGSGVVRPLSFEFPSDKSTHSIDEQFMWGGGLLFSPVLYEGMGSVNAYFPDAPWYDYNNDGALVSTRGDTESVSAPIGTIPIHVRGGHVIPTQEPDVNTELSRDNPFGLIIALDDAGNASGDLYWDDGDTNGVIENQDFVLLSFTVSDRQLTTTVQNTNDILDTMTMGTLQIYGLSSAPSYIYVNGLPQSFSYTTGTATVTGMSQQITSSFTVQW